MEYYKQAKNRTTAHFHGSRKANYCWKCEKKIRKLSAPKLTTDVKKNFAKSCNPETIRLVLLKAGYHGRNMRKKPFVSKVNHKKRIDFANENDKQDRNFWNSVIFSYESKFNIHGSDGHQKVWRKANAALELKNMRGTVKHGGGSITVWGCMAATGVGNLVIIDGIMNQYSYLNILKNNLSQRESASKLRLDGSFPFQQDNDPKHTARVVREWLLYNVRKQVKTPPQSPDLNPIEHL
ncbi:transposable element Tc1 transposase [Trichonephila clavipes]|nr:transposable element Tc1 transposase [Trichonephila clavipes]